jgi:hypothetical protein
MNAQLFFTAGDATKKTVREIWGEPYQQYLYGSGLFQRAWPQWREPLERAWQPYLDGTTSLEAAASELVAAVAQKRRLPDRSAAGVARSNRSRSA